MICATSNLASSVKVMLLMPDVVRQPRIVTAPPEFVPSMNCPHPSILAMSPAVIPSYCRPPLPALSLTKVFPAAGNVKIGESFPATIDAQPWNV